MQQVDDGDLTWTFPMRQVPASAPAVAVLRRIATAACQGLAERVRAGACPLQVAKPGPVSGWSHWHPYPEFFIQCAGTSCFDVPGGELRLRAGTCQLFPPLAAHVEHDGDIRDPFCNLVVTVYDRTLSYHLALAVPGKPGEVHVATPDVIETDHQPLLTAMLGMATEGDADVVAAGLLTLCAHMRRAIASASPPGEDGSERVRRTRDLVRSRLTSGELSVARLAEWLGCHPDHLARCFRRETGETLVGHIVRSRLERARSLLADPGLRVADAAHLSGFADPAYFCRVWRQRYGTTPSAGRISASRPVRSRTPAPGR